MAPAVVGLPAFLDTLFVEKMDENGWAEGCDLVGLWAGCWEKTEG